MCQEDWRWLCLITNNDDDCWCKAVTLDGMMYEVSGVVSGGLSDLLGKSSQWTASSERLQVRASRKRGVHDELRDLYRLQARHRQPNSQIAVKIDAQKKLLQVAEEQKHALVKMFEEFCNLYFAHQYSWSLLDFEYQTLTDSTNPVVLHLVLPALDIEFMHIDIAFACLCSKFHSESLICISAYVHSAYFHYLYCFRLGRVSGRMLM